MKRLALLALLLAACSRETAVTDTVVADTREPIHISYVGAPELAVRERAEDAAPVIATFGNGEAVSVLAEQGDWAEVRTGDRSGWAKKADLTTAAGKETAEENPQPKFRTMPMPVSAPSARGDVYIEADVNTDGEVIAVRMIQNTTGSQALGSQNMEALKQAKFYPIVVKGERQRFKYYHRVTY
ncbi:MAG TPA: TonB family protein [Thermoanaerobaculia bacterium]|nr:TonB family protein [Thermoanaerobaculia bacterium]